MIRNRLRIVWITVFSRGSFDFKPSGCGQSGRKKGDFGSSFSAHLFQVPTQHHATMERKNVRTPIFLLKTKSVPSDGYEEYFSTARDGTLFEPVFVPVLEHKFLDEGLNVVRDLLHNKRIGKDATHKYGGLIFTSQRAVEAFAALVENGKGAV